MADVGIENRNGQKLIRKTTERGNHRFARVWILKCSICKREYEANSCDFHERHCPNRDKH